MIADFPFAHKSLADFYAEKFSQILMVENRSLIF